MKLQCILKDVLRKEGNSAPLSLAEGEKNGLGLELCECSNLPGAEVGWGNGRTFLLGLGWVIVNNFKGTFQSKEAVKSFLRVLTSFRWKSQHNQSWVLKKKRRGGMKELPLGRYLLKRPAPLHPVCRVLSHILDLSRWLLRPVHIDVLTEKNMPSKHKLDLLTNENNSSL